MANSVKRRCSLVARKAGLSDGSGGIALVISPNLSVRDLLPSSFPSNRVIFMGLFGFIHTQLVLWGGFGGGCHFCGGWSLLVC